MEMGPFQDLPADILELILAHLVQVGEQSQLYTIACAAQTLAALSQVAHLSTCKCHIPLRPVMQTMKSDLIVCSGVQRHERCRPEKHGDSHQRSHLCTDSVSSHLLPLCVGHAREVRVCTLVFQLPFAAAVLWHDWAADFLRVQRQHLLLAECGVMTPSSQPGLVCAAHATGAGAFSLSPSTAGPWTGRWWHRRCGAGQTPRSTWMPMCGKPA